MVTGGAVEGEKGRVVGPVFDGAETQAGEELAVTLKVLSGMELPAKIRRSSSKRLSTNMIQMYARFESLGHFTESTCVFSLVGFKVRSRCM